MASHYDNARERTVDPGVQHPGGGPAAPGHDHTVGSEPVTAAPEPVAPASAPVAPDAGDPTPAPDPVAPAAERPTPGSEPQAPHGDPLREPASAGEPEAPVSPPDPSGEPDAPTGPAAPAEEPGGTPPPAREPAAPAGEPETPVTPAASARPSDGARTVGDAQTDAATTPSEDHERQLERDLEELAARADKADEYLELAKRTKADFENYRKRAAREAAAAQDRGIAKLARELLPAVDNLDRAVAAVESAGAADDDQPNGTATLISGIKLVHADVLAALQRAGIERYSPKGERFDPQRHEAIAQQPVEGAQPGTIVEVYQQGYLLGEAVIRPARVVVAG